MPKSRTRKKKRSTYQAPQQRRAQRTAATRPAPVAPPAPVAAPAARPPRHRVVLGVLALAVAVLVLLGGQGTYAYWNDTATASTGSFSSGKLDLTVDGAQGNPTAYAATNLALAGMVPGESVAANLTIANAGNADFTWVPTVTAAGDLGPALEVKMFLGGNQSGDDASYPRTETCTGGSALASGTTATRLNRGAAAQTVCVVVTLPTATGNAFQSKTTGSVSLALLATQVIV